MHDDLMIKLDLVQPQYPSMYTLLCRNTTSLPNEPLAESRKFIYGQWTVRKRKKDQANENKKKIKIPFIISIRRVDERWEVDHSPSRTQRNHIAQQEPSILACINNKMG